MHLSRYLVDSSDYFITEDISSNEFFIQKKAIEKKTGKFVILIDIVNNIKDKAKSRHFQMNVFQYATLFFHLHHPAIHKLNNIILPFSKKESIISATLIRKFYKNGNVAILTKEYLDTNGQNNDKMNPLIRSKIIYGVASAMKYLHDNCIINKNLTLESILLNDNLEPKLSLSIIYDFEKFINTSNDFYYFAPELIENFEFFPNSIDVYSFGFLIYRMFSNEIIFSQKNVLFNKLNFFDCILKRMKPLKPDLMPDCYWNLVSHCLCQNPDDRPDFNDIVDILNNDEFAINEFGIETDIEKLHEYQRKLFQYIEEK